MSDQKPLIDSLNAISTEIELVGFLQRLSAHFDFRGFLLLSIPVITDKTIKTRIELSDLPHGLMESYDELGLLKNSLIFEALRRSTVPDCWSTSTVFDKRNSEEAKTAALLFAEHNITQAAFVPVHGPAGERAAFGFLGDRNKLTHTELGDLGVFAAHAYNIYCTLLNGIPEHAGLLSPRELEALHWAANGKTSSEIASILSLSEHTVNAYMNNAMRKLDCVNRVQLVAKALRMHLIY